jgi:hypothetical protein
LNFVLFRFRTTTFASFSNPMHVGINIEEIEKWEDTKTLVC